MLGVVPTSGGLLSSALGGKPGFSCKPYSTADTGGRRGLRKFVIKAASKRPPPSRQPSDSGGVPPWRARSKHGKSYEDKKRRRGRPAWDRSPDDSPLRDGNRDRVIGLLTERAVKTLCYYLSETNMNIYYWLSMFVKDHPIPRDGHWDDVSGETFLRTLLSMPIEEARMTAGRSEIHNNARGCAVDPRSLAQRIMDIRTQLAKEMTQDLRDVSDENALLMRETVAFSFSLDNVVAHPTEPPLTN